MASSGYHNGTKTGEQDFLKHDPRVPRDPAAPAQSQSLEIGEVLHSAPPTVISVLRKIFLLFVLITIMSQINQAKHWHSHPINQDFRQYSKGPISRAISSLHLPLNNVPTTAPTAIPAKFTELSFEMMHNEIPPTLTNSAHIERRVTGAPVREDEKERNKAANYIAEYTSDGEEKKLLQAPMLPPPLPPPPTAVASPVASLAAEKSSLVFLRSISSGREAIKAEALKPTWTQRKTHKYPLEDAEIVVGLLQCLKH